MKSFEDLRIIDLTRILSGPFCTMYFADLGAEVIKIESPQGDDTRQWGPPFIQGESAYFLSVNRNKKSVVLDLKSPEGRQALHELVRTADVVVENFRPGTMDRLGIGFKVLSEWNPSIILASISGFGQTGPYANVPGYDVIAQGMGGLMAVTGDPDGPPVKPGFSLADISAGMWAVIGILTALRQRDVDSSPEWIDVSLLESMMAFQTYAAGNYFATGIDPTPMGSAHPNICPYQGFKAQDGFFNLAVGNDHLWHIFCHTVGHDEWTEDSRFITNADRVSHRDVLVDILTTLFSTRPVAEWVFMLRAAGVPSGPIYRLSELYRDPHVQDRNMVFTVDHPVAGPIQQVATPIKFLNHTEPPNPLKNPAPTLGQHTKDVLDPLGPGRK